MKKAGISGQTDLTRLSALLLPLLLLCAPALFAQSYRGSIRGEVHDQSGAVIAGATVRAHNISTGEERSTITAADGTFVLPELSAGHYDVTADANGFQQLKRQVAVEV